MDWKKLSGSKKFRFVAAGAGAFVVLGGAAAAVAASLAPSTAVINGCVDKNGALRIINPSSQSCGKNEGAISWNQEGPIGPAGATGATGRDGRDGLPGITGASGPTGATGPQGVQGAQGVPGVAGPQGPAGPEGPAGSGGGTVSDASSCSGANGVAYARGQEGVSALFAKIDDVKGESTDQQHKDEIDVQSFTWGGVVNTASTTTGGGGGVGKSRACPVNVLKIRTDKATPIILKAAASGQHFKEATITAVKSGGAGQFEFANYTFSDVVITNGGDSFNFIFTKVEVTYTPQKADGSADASITFGWDFAANTPL
jgi:type VI secretion system secreted protein Hcp